MNDGGKVCTGRRRAEGQKRGTYCYIQVFAWLCVCVSVCDGHLCTSRSVGERAECRKKPVAGSWHL